MHTHTHTHRWIEACIEDELPPTTELEQALRNGVILCRLGHYYAPEVIPLRRIYDFDESKYKVQMINQLHVVIYPLPMSCLFSILMYSFIMALCVCSTRIVVCTVYMYVSQYMYTIVCPCCVCVWVGVGVVGGWVLV